MRVRFPLARPALALALGFLLGGEAQVRATILPAGFLSGSFTTQTAFGTIKGRLVWSGDQVPPSRNLVEKGQAPKDPEVCAKDGAIPSRELVVDPKTKGIASAFAYLTKPSGTNPAAIQDLLARSPMAKLDQKNCEFVPYVQAMHESQTLVIKSSDPVNHNVHYSAFTNAAFNQILAPNGQLEVKLVAERRPISVACDLHPWMKAWIMVFDHPFFAVTGPDGSFEIKGVPAGEQHLVVWQEKVGYVNLEKARGTPVEVKAGQVTDVGAILLDPARVK